jgi:RNA polymerase sigma-70 factor (ECF subfamily)
MIKLEPPDVELVALAREGSRPALEALVRRYQKPVYHVCYRYVRDRDAAADLTQRAFIRAVESLSEIRTPGLFGGWLFRIGVNLSLNHLRDGARFVHGDAAIPEDRSVPAIEGALELAEESQALQAAVARLPRRQRMIVELRVYRELSFREIARELDTSANAAKVSYHHAVKKLRRLSLAA